MRASAISMARFTCQLGGFRLCVKYLEWVSQGRPMHYNQGSFEIATRSTCPARLTLDDLGHRSFSL